MEYGLGQSEAHNAKRMNLFVLILVLMEYGLGQGRARPHPQEPEVLILVLMEYGLGPVVYYAYMVDGTIVLILVLMEYGLGHQLRSNGASRKLES